MRMKKFMRNQYIYSVLTKILVVFMGFINSVVLARYFGPDIKGVTATVLNYSNILAIILTFGLHEAYPYFLKKFKDEDFNSKYMTNMIVLYLFYSLISFVICIFFKDSLLFIMCLLTSIFHGYSMIVNYVALIEKPNRRNTAVLLINFIDLLVLIFFYFLIPVNSIIACILSMAVFIYESLYFSLTIDFHFNWKFVNKKYLFSLFKFGFYPMIALLLTTLNYRIDILMLQWYKVSYSMIGIYSIGVSLAEKVFLIPTAVKEVLLSKLSKGKSSSEVIKVIRICCPICLIISICILLFGNIFINFFYGIEYFRSYSITVISVFGTIFMLFFKMISTYNIVNGKQKQTVFLLFISVLFNIILNIILIPRFNIVGAAIASDVSYCICAFLFTYLFCKSDNYSFKDFLIKKDDVGILFKKIMKK